MERSGTKLSCIHFMKPHAMKLNIYLHKEKSVLDTAYVKIGKNEVAPNKDSIVRCLKKSYGERIQYVIFTEGSKDGEIFSHEAAGNIKEIISKTPPKNFQIVECG
jgi:hypothetical protein